MIKMYLVKRGLNHFETKKEKIYHLESLYFKKLITDTVYQILKDSVKKGEL